MDFSSPPETTTSCSTPRSDNARPFDRFASAARIATAVLLCCAPTWAQYAERASLVNSEEEDIDASGRSVKNPRVRAVHSHDPNELGGTAYFIQRDPFLAYQLGRNLNFREFRSRDGVFSTFGPDLYGNETGGVADLGGPMQDEFTAKITANNQTSCLGCHNLPNGNPGGGVTFAKDSGFGRNSPHYYGGGIMEMLAIQIRTELMDVIDTNGDGWIDVAESDAAPDPLLIEATPGGGMVNFGSAKLDPATLEPQLNQILKVWYGCDGGYLPTADYMGDLGSDRYNIEVVVFGWGQLVPENALNPTLRTFLWDPLNAHSGLESEDPTTLDDPDLNGISEPSLAGAIQFPATHLAPDRGFYKDALGFSRDDPDDDGHLCEISEGDLDLGEWFMLNAPRPAFAGTQVEYDAGVALMDAMLCTQCHIADWQIKPADAMFTGDRRFFDFDVTWNDTAQRLEGKLDRLYTESGRDYVRNFDGFEVKGLFTDFAHHDLGGGFEEIGYDGHSQTKWRTAPLWGVGSGFPWGHDGASLTLRDAILRHGRDALPSKTEFVNASTADQEGVIDFLRKLQLYDIESLPADIDDDDVISENFMVTRIDTGPERFNAEWLFKTPVEIQGMVQVIQGKMIRSFAATNLSAAYGLTLPLRIDTDLDGWPDVWDAAPNTRGYRDGVNN